MSSVQINTFFSHIRQCPLYKQAAPPCSRIKKFKPVLNYFSSTQRFIIISSDPSSDTNKKLDDTVPHSDFALRFMSLIFTGSDKEESVNKIRHEFSQFQQIFNRNFYWTHFCKCYAQGHPNNYCAQTYLKKEIEIINPELIICLGNKVVDFLLGKDNLCNRVNQILHYQRIPLIASLHPSKNWNLARRPQYQFNETWQLIRDNITYTESDLKIINNLLSGES